MTETTGFEMGWKPCPFCGSKQIKFDKCTLKVKCAKCYATSGFLSKYINEGLSEDEAARTAWNTRYQEGVTDGVPQ